MRTKVISGTTLIYPDATIWLDDNILIQTKSNYGSSGARITVLNQATGETHIHTYVSDMDNVVFDIRDTLMSLYTDNMNFSVTVDAYSDHLFDGSFSFGLNVLDGKSIPGRKHGSTKTIYAYSIEDLNKVGFIFNNTGKLKVNGVTFSVMKTGFSQFKLSNVITTTGIWNACFDSGSKSDASGIIISGVEDITPFSAMARLEFTKGDEDYPNAGKGGDVWKKDVFDMDDFCIKIIYEEPCDDFDFFKVRYKDTDGIMRFLGGKVVNDKTTVNSENIYRPDLSLPYRNLSRRFIRESAGTVTVFYSMLRRDSYWNDILLAKNIEFLDVNGNWLPCSLATSEVVVDAEETQDVQLEFEIYKS